MEKIQVGDTVALLWDYPDRAWKTQEGVVLHVPQGAGDSWQIEMDGVVVLINVYSSTFHSMVLKESAWKKLDYENPLQEREG